MKTCCFLLFIVTVVMCSFEGLPGQALEPAGYFSGTIYVHGTAEPIPGSMKVHVRHRARADVYIFSGGEWRLDWRSGYWIEEIVTACPEYEHQIDVDMYNTDYPPGEEGAIHVHYSYGDTSETILYNQDGWCVIGPHVQANGCTMEGLEWHVMEKIHDQNDNSILDVFEQPLVETFCPSLVLNSGDQGVSPEPVSIMAPAHAKYLWARVYNILGEAMERRVCDDWDPPLSDYYGWLDTENYSFINGRAYMYTGAPPDAAFQVYYLVFHLEWAGQGNTASQWRAAYSSEAVNNYYDDTIYAHLYFLGTSYLIQYWFFYPFNDYINNHEGDWEHINVIVDSQDPSDAQILRVEYYFHHNVLSASSPGDDFLLEDGSHPVVFVGGSGDISFGSGDGSHGSFPINGMWTESGGGCCWLASKPDEYVDGAGRYLRYDGLHVVNVPEPYTVNYFEHPEWSWLKADIPWGHINVDSPGDWLEEFSWISVFFGECCFPDDLGDYAPSGPAYNGGWDRIGPVDGWYDGYSKVAPFVPVTGTNWVPPMTTQGDFSGDGKVDIIDVLGVIDIILHLTDPSPYQFWAADMRDDGQINVMDVMSIVNAILGVPTDGGSQPEITCIMGLFETGEDTYEIRLDNAAPVSGIQLHLLSDASLHSIHKTDRSSLLDSAFKSGSDEAIIVLYGSQRDSIDSGDGPVVEFSCSGDDAPCITKAILAAPDGSEIPVVVQVPPKRVDLFPIQDVYLSAHSAYQTYNYGRMDMISTGRNSKYPGYIHRTLLEFDLSGIPSGVVVDEASFHLFVVGNSRCKRTTELNVYRMEHGWLEGTGNHAPSGDGATWLTSDGFTNWEGGPGAAGPGDCEQTAIGAVAIPYLAGIGQEITIPLDAAALEEMLDGGSYANNGFLIKDTDEYQDAYVYHSSESADSPSLPRLEIVYRGCGAPDTTVPTEENNPPSITIVNPPSGGAPADEFYLITWSSSDPDADVCTVDLYYDTNTSPGGRTQIVLSTADVGSCAWNTSGVPEGSYYVYGVIDDGNGGTDSDYSDGRVTIEHDPGEPSCDPPQISSLNPNSGDAGLPVWIFGNHFGDTQGTSHVMFYPNQIASVDIWSDTQIRCAVPVGTENGNVTVTTDCGTSAGEYFAVTQGGCPYVSPWIGDEYAVGNNILAASEDTNRAELNVVDYFRLEEPCVERDGRYWLKMREFEQEHTSLDEVKLLSVDHPRGLNLGLTDEGEFFLYKREIGPVFCVDSAGIDQLELIDAIGGGDYEGFPDDWLTIHFGRVRGVKRLYVQVVADLQPPPPKDQTIVLQLRGEHEWEWQDIALLHPRENWATHLVDLSPWVDRGAQEIVIRLYWLAQHKVDYVGLVRSVPGLKKVKECVLESAFHSEVGTVTDSLLYVDERYAELAPGQEIELAFLPVKSTKGFKRDFVLVATGYYVKEGPGAPAKGSMAVQHAVPMDYGLSQNYPNPFNTNTEIRYQMSVPSCIGDGTEQSGSPVHTTLKVFNIMGQEVRTLVDAEKQPGYHVATWDGRDAYGQEVSSGIYFYRLSVGGTSRDNRGDFTETRPMVLMK